MAITPPGQAPVLHKTVSTNAQTVWNQLMSTIGAQNKTKVHTLADLANTTGLSTAILPTHIAELADSEHIRNAHVDKGTQGRYPGYYLAPSNL